MAQKNKKGFTLVELIVVIVILAILGTIAFISMQGYSKSSRDSVRISDVSAMKTSLELFHVDAGKYPLPDDWAPVTFSGETLWYQGKFGDNVVTNVSRNMQEAPRDPLNDKLYTYSVQSNKNKIQILTLLEWEELAYVPLEEVQAAGSLQVTPRVDGNYEWIFVRSNLLILPLPSIMTAAEIGTGLTLDATTIDSMIVTWGDNVPDEWNYVSNTGGLDINLSPYYGEITADSDDNTKKAVMEAIQWAYTGTTLANEWVYEYVLTKTSTGDLVSLTDNLVLWDSAAVVAAATSSSTSSSTTSSGGGWNCVFDTSTFDNCTFQ